MEYKLLLPLLLLLSLVPLSAALPSQAILSAAEVLSNSGTSVSMALTLELVADAVASLSPTITVFSPSDSAFSSSGQPSLSLLHLHLSPLSLPPSTLRSLPYGTKIPTMSSGKSLTITSLPSSQLSINNVTVSESPIYDDGSLIVFQTSQFFDPNFTSPSPPSSPQASPQCLRGNPSPFQAASHVLRSRGYSVTASFLDLQLVRSQNLSKLTFFAPIDDVIIPLMGNFSDYAGLMLRHVAPCTVRYADLAGFREGALLGTYSEGFGIKVNKSSGLVMVNDIPVTFPDMYDSDWLVVHGLHEVLEPLDEGAEVGQKVDLGSSSRSTEF